MNESIKLLETDPTVAFFLPDGIPVTYYEIYKETQYAARKCANEVINEILGERKIQEENDI